MIGRRLIAFMATVPVLTGAYLLHARWTGFWERPKINEASEVISFYLVILFAVLFALMAIAVFGFPSAMAADRLFQRNGRRPFAPYGFFVGLSVVVAGVLMVTLNGEKHIWDFPMVVSYFAACASIIWKVAYELPRKS